MISFLFTLFLASQGPAAPARDACEWIGPRIDGISVQICAGEVRAYRDQSGNVTPRSERF